MTFYKKTVLGLAATAMLVGSVTPAIARDYDDYGYGRRHHDRVDGGDILTGIGILAGIAIIASAASKSNKRSDRDNERYPTRYPDNSQNRTTASNDVGVAVSACSNAAERSAGSDARVQEIRSVTRDGAAWQVEGTIGGGRSNSDSFSCAATNGEVDYIRLGGRAL
jgi:hypothetical protein